MQLNSGGNLLYICVPREFVDFPFYCLFVCSWKPIINYINEQYDNYFRDESGVSKTVNIDTFSVDIEEKGVKLRLTVVDTPGFADAVDNTDS